MMTNVDSIIIDIGFPPCLLFASDEDNNHRNDEHGKEQSQKDRQ